ncbi:low affinity immunoglobulin gamma Fc region receptor III-like [Channa argus]|uniref:low affinity immunoglobulin gamma Fc region receptor III-like n=1 Tax=Channa argus TaxID=215402 RepID=UPI003521809F
MKTPPVSLLLGVSVLLLAGWTVSAVSLSVSPNLQQFFIEESVSLRCDGQGVSDGWSVKRNKGGQTEQCGAAEPKNEECNGSCCFLDLYPSDTGVYWCEDRTGERSDNVNISTSDGPLILEIPALPVMTGDDVTLRCRSRHDSKTRFYFYKNNVLVKREHNLQFVISKVQQSDEGLYSCSTDEFESPQSWLRVRDPPTTPEPPTTALYTPPPSSSLSSSPTLSPLSSIFLGPIVAVVGSVIFLVTVIILLLWKKQTGTNAGRAHSSPPDDVTYAEVTFTKLANKRGPSPRNSLPQSEYTHCTYTLVRHETGANG